MVVIRQESASDIAAREALLDEACPQRSIKPSNCVRDHRLPARKLALVIEGPEGLLGTVRLWNIKAGRAHGLLLGPLAVAAGRRDEGLGGLLMDHALMVARREGHRFVVLVGDEAYYRRFGFCAETAGRLALPGQVEQHRLLAVELVPGALDGVGGLITGTGPSLLRLKPRRVRVKMSRLGLAVAA